MATGTTETAWCQEQDCGWSREAATRTAGEDAYVAHLAHEHPAAVKTTDDGSAVD